MFAERWPALSRPGLYSPAFHEFLRRCSEPALGRPGAAELLKVRWGCFFWSCFGERLMFFFFWCVVAVY